MPHPLTGAILITINLAFLEEALLNSHLFTIINTGEVTRIGHPHPPLAIDLTLCREQIAWRCSWQIIPDLAGSDHFPILTHFSRE